MNNIQLTSLFIIILVAAFSISALIIRSNSDSEIISNLTIEAKQNHIEIVRLNGELDYQQRIYDIQTGQVWALSSLLKDTMDEYLPEYEKIISENLTRAKQLIRKSRGQ